MGSARQGRSPIGVPSLCPFGRAGVLVGLGGSFLWSALHGVMVDLVKVSDVLIPMNPSGVDIFQYPLMDLAVQFGGVC